MKGLRLDSDERERIWRQLIGAIEDYQDTVDDGPVSPRLDPDSIRSLLDPLDFSEPMESSRALDWVLDGLKQFQTHTPHARYFGLFNPAPTTMSIVGDTVAAAFNPQLAAWSHSPLAVEIEQHLLRALGSRFGYPAGSTEGTFASGGAEANHTAVLTALTRAFPEFAGSGVRALSGAPTLYISEESHHSFLKAARLCGLGSDAVRLIPVDQDLRMIVAEARDRIASDRQAGALPFLIVGTAGTTSAGAVDPLPDLADLAAREDLWLHVDAAWGGGFALVPEMASILGGIEKADSITFDAHKLLSVPMGAGLYLTRHPGMLERTFSTAAGYMPREARGLPVTDPYSMSMQWSRRFTGLKLFLSLLVAGWDGYATAIRHQVEMGSALRDKLVDSGWKPMNRTRLPVICFVDGRMDTQTHLSEALSRVLQSGEAWISIAELPHHGTVLRACITNYLTGLPDLDRLVTALHQAREDSIGVR